MKAALRAGYSVRALARSAACIPIQDAGLDKVPGDALNSDMIRNALQGVDVVIQTLGLISHLGQLSNAQLCSRNPRASWWGCEHVRFIVGAPGYTRGLESVSLPP